MKSSRISSRKETDFVRLFSTHTLQNLSLKGAIHTLPLQRWVTRLSTSYQPFLFETTEILEIWHLILRRWLFNPRKKHSTDLYTSMWCFFFFYWTPEKARYRWARVTQCLHGNFLLFLALFRLTHRRAISFLSLSGDCIISSGEEPSQDNNANSESQYFKKTWFLIHYL